jgi:hypothetical protein
VTTTPIADYALLSDRHSAALVSRGGSIDWLCFPRFDSASTFGRLLDEKAGHWFFGATNATEVSRRYLDRTMEDSARLRLSSSGFEGGVGARRPAQFLVDTLEEPIRYTEGKSIGIKR